jgi:hypothetical protein
MYVCIRCQACIGIKRGGYEQFARNPYTRIQVMTEEARCSQLSAEGGTQRVWSM